MLRTNYATARRGAVLAAVGIQHEFIELGCPWQNRIERFCQTLKQKLKQVAPRSPEALGEMLAQFACWYNEVRPHQHLHGFTSAEVWQGIDPYVVSPKAVHRFEAWDRMLTGYYLRR